MSTRPIVSLTPGNVRQLQLALRETVEYFYSALDNDMDDYEKKLVGKLERALSLLPQ